MAELSREDEIRVVVAAARPYLDLPVEDLELLFEEALDEAELGSLPHRGASDRSSWRRALDRLKKEVAQQETAAAATAVYAASQAVDWAHGIGIVDLTDYNVPIAIFVALAVKAVWTQMRSDSIPYAAHDDQHDQ